MSRPPYYPRWALVQWPDAYDPTVPSCIPLESVADAVSRGAMVIGREDREMFQPAPVRKEADGRTSDHD